jgi:Small Multidrug Resistance (SMR) protein
MNAGSACWAARRSGVRGRLVDPRFAVHRGDALREIPVGTGYAIWVGIGAVGTALYGMAVLGEPATALRLLCLVAIVGGVVGLKFLH